MPSSLCAGRLRMRYNTAFRLSLVTLAFLTLVQVGCGSNDAATSPESNGFRQYLTADAARNVGSSQTFTLSATQADPQGELGERQANEIAVAFTREFGPLGRDTYEGQHSGPIDFALLHPCGRTLYARSSYEPMERTVDPGIRFEFGSWWIIGMCSAGTRPDFAVAVSSLATDLRTSGDHVVFPPIFGREIVATGVPIGWESQLPITPEAAATMVATRGRTLVAQVPELIAPAGRDGGPFAAFWRIGIATPIDLIGQESHRRVHSGDVYVGVMGGWKQDRHAMKSSADMQLPLSSQPTGQSFLGLDLAAATAMIGRPFVREPALVSGTALPAAGVPTRFESADLPTGGN